MRFYNIIPLLLSLCCLAPSGYSQITIERLDDMVRPISNNVIASVKDATGADFLLSIGGIDSTKIFSGISTTVQSYEIGVDNWLDLSNIPFSTMPTIAASGQSYNDIIYYLGGYTVLENGNEISSTDVLRFDLSLGGFIENGAPIPTPIDDHVHVSKENLIYLVTGWSNTTNVGDVQVYYIDQNTWSEATPVPNSQYRAFGASGALLGDTIYYAGGAKIGTNFPLARHLRKGAINPNNPLDITWTVESNDLAGLYRSACFTHEEKVYWIGGSTETYNFDGLAYAGNTPVEPQTNLISYDPKTGQMEAINIPELAIMDLRSIVPFGDNIFYIAGGMGPGQQVSDATYKLTMPITSNIDEPASFSEYNIYPNPSNGLVNIDPEAYDYVELLDTQGRIISRQDDKKPISIRQLIDGNYYLKIVDKGKITIQKIVKTN